MCVLKEKLVSAKEQTAPEAPETPHQQPGQYFWGILISYRTSHLNNARFAASLACPKGRYRESGGRHVLHIQFTKTKTMCFRQRLKRVAAAFDSMQKVMCFLTLNPQNMNLNMNIMSSLK